MIAIWRNADQSATCVQVIVIWSIFVASCCNEAAKTTRGSPHQTIAPMHIAQGSPDV